MVFWLGDLIFFDLWQNIDKLLDMIRARVLTEQDEALMFVFSLFSTESLPLIPLQGHRQIGVRTLR